MSMRFTKKETAPAASVLSDEELHRRIAQTAYERYLNRGQIHGHDLDDWLDAERLVVAELGARVKTTRPRRPMAGPRTGRQAGRPA